MSSILTRRPDDRPPQREDWGTGVTISIAAHLALVGALVWGVHWHSNAEPEGSSAELWSAVPEAAAPPPVTAPTPPVEAPPPVPQPPVPAPPPPPVAETPKPPDIVTEQLQEKKKLKEQQDEQAKLDKAKADQAKADADKKLQQQQQQKQLDAQKLAKLHDDNLKRMMGQMDAPAGATGTAARNSGPSATYRGRVIARVRPNIVLTDAVSGNAATEVEVRCAPDGTIIGRRITQSSGVKEWDDTVLRAIDRTGILPRDTDGSIPSPMLLTFRPQDAPG